MMDSHLQNFLQSPEFTPEYDSRQNEPEMNEFCKSDDYMKFRVMEFGVKSIPALIFFILGVYRWTSIRDIGVGNTTFSTHFKAKMIISMLQAVADFIYIIIVLALPASVKHSSWINQCD